MSIVPVKYPLDLTGAAASNRVTNEQHTLPNTNIRVFVPQYGAFFSDSVAVRDAATNRTLIKGVDYYPSLLYAGPTAQTGRDIHQVIVITDATCSANILFDAQMLGGEYSYSFDAIVQLVKNLALDSRTVQFNNIIGKPDAFNPAPHLHDAGDLYGFEYLSASLDRVRDAILLGSAAGQKGLYNYLDNQIAQLQASISQIASARSTKQSIINTLGYTPMNAGGGTFSDDVTFNGETYYKGGKRELVQVLTATSSITTLDLSVANHFVVTLGANTTLKFDTSKITGLTGKDYIKFTMLQKNDATGNRTLALPGNIIWAGRIVGARAIAANTVNEYEFVTYDGGLTWIARVLGADLG
jgi:hypothetical protein